MLYNKNENSLTAENPAVLNADKESAGMSVEQLNEYLVKRSAVICEYVRKKRSEYQSGKIPHTSDVMPPICYTGMQLQKNIDSVLACFKSKLGAALSSETRYIQTLENFEALSSIVETEKYLIFDFLSENGLTDRFNDFVNLKKISV